MAAAIWTGAIAFGLINIPVKLVSAVRSHDLSFRMLHRGKTEKDLSPIAFSRTSKKTGKEVPWKEIVKGYEYEKERFVVLTEEDFEKAALATTKNFEIREFTPEQQVDPRYFEKPYYLIPQKGGEKAYALLREAMRKTGTLGIGTITMRQKQYLASIKPVGESIVLDLMRFADEVLDENEYRFPEGKEFHPKELMMAEQLIENLKEDFNPERYEDEYKANLEKIIAAKMKGKSIDLVEAAEPEMTGVIDLMEKLEQSLKTAKKGGGGESGGGKSVAKRAKKKKSAA
ncbi:MAG: Ku protein [Gemmatimonadetes bacterium]|nr:Ku protein [Gemmatimonadota bacterium]